MTDTTPTALDWLRYTRARGTQLLDTIDSLVADIAADMDVAVDLIGTLKDLLEPRPLPGTPGYYSDGREVWTDVELGEGGVYVHYWHPDPAHPDNQPHELCTVRTSGGRYRIAVTGPGRLEAASTLALCETGVDA